MTGGHRIGKLERRFSSGETYVLFVIRNAGRTSASARIAGQILERHAGETEDELIDRALQTYRKACPSDRSVSAVVVDCRH